MATHLRSPRLRLRWRRTGGRIKNKVSLRRNEQPRVGFYPPSTVPYCSGCRTARDGRRSSRSLCQRSSSVPSVPAAFTRCGRGAGVGTTHGGQSLSGLPADQGFQAHPDEGGFLGDSGQAGCFGDELVVNIQCRSHMHQYGLVGCIRQDGSIVISDRSTPIAQLIPFSGEPPENLFKQWKPLKKFAEALDRPVGGTPVEDIIDQDRNR